MKGMNKSYEQTVAALHYLKEKEYWLNKFSGQWTKSSFPYDHNRTNNEGGEKIVQFQFTGEVFFKLMKLSNGSDQRLYMILTAVLTVLLHRYTGSSDIIIGTPSLKQDSEAEFINTLLILRNPAETRMTFKQLLFQVRQDIIEATENQNYPVDTLPRQLNISYLEEDGFPLFDVAILVENIHHKTYIEHLRFNTLFSFSRTEEQVGGKVEFNTEVYHPRMMERITTHFKRLLESFLEDVNTRLSEVEMLSGEEKQKLLQDFNNTAAQYPYHYPGHKNVCQLFREQVERGPGNTALVGGNPKSQIPNPKRGAPFGQITACGGMQLSYRQLNEKSDQLAHLLQEKGVEPDTIVAIMVERSLEMIIGILGILKAGGAYLPIDPDYPEERIQYMLKDSNAQVLVVDDTSCASWLSFAPKAILNLSEGQHLNFPASQLPSFPASLPSSLAYIIYTSGTTGKPKAVMIQHRNVVRLMVNDRSSFDFSENDVWTMFHSYCFDFSVWEMYGALLYGGKLVIIPKMTARDPKGFLKELKEKNVTILNQTPTAFYNLSTEELKHHTRDLNLRWIIFGGEALKPSKLFQWRKKYPGIKLINMFGITETTVHVTYKEITGKEIELDISNIGKPIPTLSTYILDKNLQLLPPGIPGELCVGGEGAARGYLNRVELTAKKFLANPYKPKEIIYRSGDRAKFLDNGEMEYLGRIDHQFQVKGYRIEPGEIENQLLKYKNIKEAVVVVKGEHAPGTVINDTRDKYLCAYIVPEKGTTLELSQLGNYLSAHLPDYMVPLFFVEMEEIPLTANGKVNRKKLIGMGHLLKLEVEYLPPRDKTEKKLVEIWKNLLKIEKVGIMDSFFNIGGDSIKTINLLNIINKEFDTNFEVVELYENETIEKIANKIEKSKIAFVDHEYKNVHRELTELKNRIIKDNKLSNDIDDIYPLSEIEKGMIYYSLKDMSSSVYHDQIVFQVKEEAFDDRLLKRSLALMVQKHSLLRSGYNMFDFEEPVHIVYGYKDKEGLIDYEHIDISDLDRDRQEEYINTMLEKDRENTFVFNGEKPVWRMRTAARDNENICFIWTCHHAMIDGWSTASLMTELNNTYWQLRKEVNFVPGMLESSYKDFVIQQTTWKRKSEAMDYWKNELGDYKRFNFPGPPGIENQNNPSRGKKTKNNHLDLQLLQQLKEVAIKYNTNIKDLCFGAYVYMLNMLSYENDIVVGLVTNNRPVCEDGDKIIGCFLNTVPVRIIIPNNISWKDLIYLVREKILELKKYDKLSLFEIVHGLGEQTQGRNPIFDTIFNYIDFHVYGELKQSSVNGDIVEGGDGVGSRLYVEGWNETNTWFDFTVDVTMGTFRLLIKYSNWAVDDEMVNLLCNYFRRILIAFVHEPESLTGKNKIISPREKQKILYEFNDNRSGYPKDKILHGLFREQAARTPDITAIVGRGQSLGGCHTLTYREFNERANQLAHLLQTKGLKPDTIVGIMTERSVEMIIGILSILKAGGAYLPIDPLYPEKRIQYILTDSNARVLLTDNHLSSCSSCLSSLNCELLTVTDQLSAGHSSNHHLHLQPATVTSLAYIIYTSGSTGKPKGIMVEHRNAVNLVYGLNEKIYKNYDEGLKVCLFAPYVFDASVKQIFAALLLGHSLYIVPDETRSDGERVLQFYKKHQIDISDGTPSHLQLILEAVKNSTTGTAMPAVSPVKHFLIGGEELPRKLARDFLNAFEPPGPIITNVYGPTECTVDTTSFDVILDYLNLIDTVPIGAPLGNLSVYILDSNNNLQPGGVPGELCIAGDGVARGYLNNPGLTAEKFRRNVIRHSSFVISSAEKASKAASDQCPMNNDRFYLTGDLARWLIDGNIEFLGRIDHQVKIRGFRVELGEIENCLLSCNRVKEAAVVVKETQTNDKHLCAYLVPDILEKGDAGAGENELSAVLKEYLLSRLPAYMIPQYFVPLEMLPLTVNGKLDRKSLPESGISSTGEYTAPRDEREEKLAEIWSQVLGVNKEIIGIDDNFFDLGGHSLSAIKLEGRIKKEFGTTILLDELFQTPTIRGISSLLEVTRWVKEQGNGTNLQQQGKEILL